MKPNDINLDAVLRGFHNDLDESGNHLIARLLPLCGSPIEVMMGAALLLYDKLCEPWPRGYGNPLVLARHDELPDWPKDQRLLIPQYPNQRYRIDWAIREQPYLVFIECDGHDFHERTKAQAAHDRKKDRVVQSGGNPILRFTGSEIHRDAIGCAREVFDFVLDLWVPIELRTAAE